MALLSLYESVNTENLIAPVIHSQPMVNDAAVLNFKVKWHYLIANHLSFSDKTGYNIHLPKPDQDTLFQWLLKIIASGQASSIFVEDFNLDEVRAQKIKNLCSEHQVKLVNLSLHAA